MILSPLVLPEAKQKMILATHPELAKCTSKSKDSVQFGAYPWKKCFFDTQIKFLRTTKD